jgi:hypothetical protein
MEMNAKSFLLIMAGVLTSDKKSISGKQLEYLKAQAFLAMKAEGIPFMEGDDEDEPEEVQKSAELPKFPGSTPNKEQKSVL